jgi:hypothetical protein
MRIEMWNQSRMERNLPGSRRCRCCTPLPPSVITDISGNDNAVWARSAPVKLSCIDATSLRTQANT